MILYTTMSVNTQRSYVNKISTLRNKYDVKDLNNVEDVILKISNHGAYHLRSCICSILWWNKNVKMNIWDGNFQKLDELVIEKYKKKLSDTHGNDIYNGVATFVQSKKMTSWKNIIELRNDIIEDNPFSLNALIISLYTFIPPRRLEYSDMFYIDECDEKITEDSEKNYCVKDGDNMYLIFNNYKSRRTVGRVRYDIPDKLKNIIVGYVEKNNINNNEPLLNISRNSLNIRLNKIFDGLLKEDELLCEDNDQEKKEELSESDGFSVQILRHIYATWIYIHSKNISPGMWIKIALLMGHTFEGHVSYSKHLNVIYEVNDDFFKFEIQPIFDINVKRLKSDIVIKK